MNGLRILLGLRRRAGFPADVTVEQLRCPHCRCGTVAIDGDERMLWHHYLCNAYGYYDDGSDVFPGAVYRVKGHPGVHRHGGLVVD